MKMRMSTIVRSVIRDAMLIHSTGFANLLMIVFTCAMPIKIMLHSINYNDEHKFTFIPTSVYYLNMQTNLVVNLCKYLW